MNGNESERRKKADWIVRMAAIFSILSWVVAFTVWIFIDQASPEKGHMFTSAYNVAVREHWDETFLPLAFGLLIAALLLCIMAFFFNKLRMRRKTDKYRKSIITIGVITIVGIVMFVIRFGVNGIW